MEALQKVLLGLPSSEALNSWPNPQGDMDMTVDINELIRGLPDSLEELLTLVKEGNVTQAEVDKAAEALQEQGLTVQVTQEGLERVMVIRGNWLSEATIASLAQYFCVYTQSKVRPKKKYAVYAKEAERQHISFGKKQAGRYYLLSILVGRALSLPSVLPITDTEEAAALGLFWLRYWLNPVLHIDTIPPVDRVVEWIEAVLASHLPLQDTTLEAIQTLIDEHVSRSESVQWLRTLSSLPDHAIPVAPTPVYSRISL